MARTEVTGKQIKDQSVDLTVDVTGVLPVANGGSGSDTLPINSVLLGNGTGALQAVSPGTEGYVLTSNGSTWVASAPTGGGSGTGDVTTNTFSSVDGEVVLFSGTTGKSLKRATGTGYATLTSGVLSAAASIPQSAITSLTTDLAGKEPTITAGTATQYWRGDKSWQTLNVAAVPGAEATANKGQPNGYASLNASGVIPYAQQTYLVLDGGSANSPGIDLVDGGTP